MQLKAWWWFYGMQIAYCRVANTGTLVASSYFSYGTIKTVVMTMKFPQNTFIVANPNTNIS